MSLRPLRWANIYVDGDVPVMNTTALDNLEEHVLTWPKLCPCKPRVSDYGDGIYVSHTA